MTEFGSYANWLHTEQNTISLQQGLRLQKNWVFSKDSSQAPKNAKKVIAF